MVSDAPLTYRRLRSALAAYGYTGRKVDSHEVFQHALGQLVAVFPMFDDEREVRPVHLTIAESTIRDDGIVDIEDFRFYLAHGKKREDLIQKGDHLVWLSSGREIPVIAAASEEDGAVVVKQNGSLSACPTNQLRKLPAP